MREKSVRKQEGIGKKGEKGLTFIFIGLDVKSQASEQKSKGENNRLTNPSLIFYTSIKSEEAIKRIGNEDIGQPESKPL